MGLNQTLPRSSGAAACGGRRMAATRLGLPSRTNRPLQQQQQRRPARQPLAVTASVPKSVLASYRFARPPAQHAEWFQQAVRDIVRHVDRTPFLQLVQLGGLTPRFTTVPVAESVVPVPELWRGIAQHMAGGSEAPDVVILVQQVNPSASTPVRVATASADETAAWASAAGEPSNSGDWCEPPVTNAIAAAAAAASAAAAAAAAERSCVASSLCKDGLSVAQRVESACQRLVQAGLAAESLVTGKVGDCCNGEGGRHAHSAGSSGSSSAIVPFLAAAPRRRAVQAAALGSWGQEPALGAALTGGCDKDVCYYGVVVQSAQHSTGVEGCYLLKTVKMVSPTGCACTHFSLTRVCQGEHLEQQFVSSWLV